MFIVMLSMLHLGVTLDGKGFRKKWKVLFLSGNFQVIRDSFRMNTVTETFSKNRKIQFLGCQALEPSGTWAYMHLGSWVLRLLCNKPLWVVGSMGSWAHGLLGSWALGLMGSWAHGLLGSWIYMPNRCRI
jgi:hypothetical protein